MNLPHRRTPKRHAFDQNIMTAVGLNELRPQIAAFAKYAFTHRRCPGDVIIKQRARFTLIWIAFFPTALRPSFPRPPMFAIGIAVDHAFTGDRHISLLKGIDERRVIHQLHTFPSSKDQRQVLPRILTEFDRGAFGDIEVDVAFEMNRAG